MATRDLLAGIPLGPQQVTVRKMEVHPAHGVDVIAGRLPNTQTDHYLQVTLVGEGIALLLPAPEAFLRNLARQCAEASGMPQPLRNATEET